MDIEGYDISKLTSKFKIEALREILKVHFVDSKTRITEDTLQLVAEVVRVLTTEATLRAGRQAHIEGMTEVRVSHVEKILPQLVSDDVMPCNPVDHQVCCGGNCCLYLQDAGFHMTND
ncbi:centromere protein X isoform X2 [Cryptotermes secundus]|uniref:centromere protein X isoform X2 n=1 Tax=Cryptotermes secundus TaxID=105785 RepID=UPI001454C302|nr:centromere protein X isoform X2 [Cryptotermes secundus]